MCVSIVAVISAVELWSAMEPEVLQTVIAHLEPSSEEEEARDEGEEKEEEDEERSDRDTAIQIAQFLRENKYR